MPRYLFPLIHRQECLAYFSATKLPGSWVPCKIHGNIHAEKSIHLKILEWASIVHGYGRDPRISIRGFLMNGLCGMDIAWTLHPGFRREVRLAWKLTEIKSSASHSAVTAHDLTTRHIIKSNERCKIQLLKFSANVLRTVCLTEGDKS